MKEKYEKNLRKLRDLLSTKGVKIQSTKEFLLENYKKSLAPYFVPEELLILYQYIDFNLDFF